MVTRPVGFIIEFAGSCFETSARSDLGSAPRRLSAIWARRPWSDSCSPDGFDATVPPSKVVRKLSSVHTPSYFVHLTRSIIIPVTHLLATLKRAVRIFLQIQVSDKIPHGSGAGSRASTRGTKMSDRRSSCRWIPPGHHWTSQAIPQS